MKNSRFSYLAKNTLIFTIGNIGTKIIGFFLVPLYTNVLLKSEYGTVDLIITISTFVVPILICNISEAIMRFALDKGSDLNKIMSVGIAFIGISFALSLMLFPLIRVYQPLSDYAWYACAYFFTSGCCSILQYYLRGKELLLHFSIGNIIHAFSLAILNIVFLLQFHWGITGLLSAYLISNSVTAAYAFFAGNVFDVIRHFGIDKKLSIQMLKYSIVLIPNSFMWWIMDSSDRIMLTSMIGVASTGLYAVANKLPSIIATISNIFNQAWNYSAIREDDSADRESFINMVFNYLFSFVIFSGVALLLLIKPILSVYVAESYYEAWSITPPLIVGTCILVLATFLSSQYTVQKDSKAFLISSSIGAVVNIAFNLLLIPGFHEIGAGLATCISYMAVYSYRSYDIRRYVIIKTYSPKKIVQYVLLIIASGAVYLDSLGYYLGVGCVIAVIIINWSSWSEFFKARFLNRKRHNF